MLQRVLLALVLAPAVAVVAVQAAPMTVYKSPTCGCCKNWLAHVERRGFEVQVQDVPDVVPHKIEGGVPPKLASCHTAFIEGYVVEGHVPAADIARLLAERPDARGLALPGMPIGSPGMEYGPRKDPYDVLLIHHDGTTSVFSSH